jgi:hypothetical protein
MLNFLLSTGGWSGQEMIGGMQRVGRNLTGNCHLQSGNLEANWYY